MSMVAIVAGLLGAQSYISSALDRESDRRDENEMAVRTAMLSAALDATGAFDTQHGGEFVRAQSNATHARITLIAPDGRVVADSSVDGARLATLENHGRRPEVLDAVRSGIGFSQRESTTVRESLLYVARRVNRPDGAWVIRLAVSRQRFDEAHRAIRGFLLWGAVLGLLTALVLSSLAAELLSRPVRSLTASARAMRGDLAVRTGMHRSDEIGELAGALDELANGLSASLKSLEHERDRLGAILEAMAEGVLVADTDGRIVLANRALREMFYVGRDVIGRAPVDAINDADLPDMISQATRERTAVSREVSITGLRPRRLNVYVSPVEDSGAGVVAVFSDVTELRHLETVRRDFVANVSHELRTPIAAVRAAAETLLDGALEKPDEAHEFVSIVERHAERLHRIVEDLLELSRIEARQLAVTLTPLPVRETVERSVELFRLPAEKKRVTLRTDIADVPRVLADRSALEHIVSNLIDNAIKYAPEGATVAVSARRNDHGGVVLVVRDNGHGIPAKHLPRIFERFYRVDTGRSRQLGGTGLGLAIVKHLVEAIGASIRVESDVGKGTAFFIDLDAAPA